MLRPTMNNLLNQNSVNWTRPHKEPEPKIIINPSNLL